MLSRRILTVRGVPMNPKLAIIITAGAKDVELEARFEHLNRRGFVRAAQEKHAWYLFLNAAWKASKLPMNEQVKEYLALMLYRFARRADLFAQMESFDCYLNFIGRTRPHEADFKDYADACLQYVAFFQRRSRYRHQPRTLERVAEMGVGFYDRLVRLTAGKDDSLSVLYPVMAKSFGLATMVLRAACPNFALQRYSTNKEENSTYHVTEGSAIALELSRAFGEKSKGIFEEPYFQGSHYN